jgi:signal transduction histidine kinase
MLAAHVQGQFEAEKARIARRLHGDVAGMLAAARMDLSRLAGAHADDAGLREQVARVDQILEAVIQNARSEMQRLHPALLDHFGLSAALRHLVEQACRAGGAEYTLELPDFADARVSAPMALAAYRAIEALLEAGSLSRVTVTLRENASQVLLHVDVDRTSPPPSESNNDLLALRAWLEALGASWSESDRGNLTSLDLALPPQAATAPTATPAS